MSYAPRSSLRSLRYASQKPWLDENLNLNAFHNNKKKIKVDHSVKYRQTTAVNKERYIY